MSGNFSAHHFFSLSGSLIELFPCRNGAFVFALHFSSFLRPTDLYSLSVPQCSFFSGGTKSVFLHLKYKDFVVQFYLEVQWLSQQTCSLWVTVLFPGAMSDPIQTGDQNQTGFWCR